MDYDISPPLIFKFQISSSRLCLSEEISYATGSRSRIYIYIYARFCATSMQPVKLCKSVYVKLCHTSVDWGKENIYFLGAPSFRVKVSYRYSKIIQSKHCIIFSITFSLDVCVRRSTRLKLCKSVYVKLCHTSVDWGKENIYFMENICFLHSYGAPTTESSQTICK
jgi:hypothetical protein